MRWLRIACAESAREQVPHGRVVAAVDVAAHDPEDVRLTPVALREETAVRGGVIGVQLLALHQRAPGGDQRYVDTALGGAIDDPIDMVPVAFSGTGNVRLGGIAID